MGGTFHTFKRHKWVPRWVGGWVGGLPVLVGAGLGHKVHVDDHLVGLDVESVAGGKAGEVFLDESSRVL